jgi:hypothetical protein
MMRRAGLIAILSLITTVLFAQNKGSIKGELKDSLTKQVLAFATVTVFDAKDTSVVSYRLSDPSGKFQVPAIPFNLRCRVVISMQGYRGWRKEFELTKETPQLDLHTIFLNNDPKELDDVTVIAERPPVVMRNDTLEFNASAFKTLPSALVEDLLKKLPGVEVDLDGNLTVKGKKVNRLLVDGKEFFGGDHKLATRNLPANLVDKVQVADDKEELESNPQMTKDEVGQIINIKLKKAVSQGWFGKAYAGIGTDERHEAGAIVNIFKDTAQISLLGYSNNVNKPAFGFQELDQIGGLNRGGSRSAGSTVTEDMGGQGIQQSRGAGFNYNNLFGKRFTVNLQYFYGHTNAYYSQMNNTQRFFGDTILATESSNVRQSKNNSHRISGSVNFKMDSMTTFILRPSFNYSDSRNKGFLDNLTTDNFKGKTNGIHGDNNFYSRSPDYSHSLSISHRFRKKGRFLNITSNLSTRDGSGDAYSDNVYTFYLNSIGKDSVINQLRASDNSNFRSDLNISLTEPISKSTSLVLTNQSNYLREDNDQGYFYKDYQTGNYDVYSNLYSNGVERAGWRNYVIAFLSIKVKKWLFRPGVTYYSAVLKNRYMKNPGVDQRLSYVYPSLSINYNSLTVSYRANINEPSANDLQQVIDISNLFYKSYGNPSLQPTYAHSVSANYYKYSPKGHSLSFNLNGTLANNTVVRNTSIDSRRVSESRPFNVDGRKSINANFNYTRQYKMSKKYRLSVSPAGNYNFSSSFVSFNNNLSRVENQNINGWLRVSFNYNDVIEFNQRYGLTKTSSRYQDKTRYKNVDYNTESGETELVIRWPKHFVWESLMNYSYNPRVAPGYRKQTVRWNAGASYLFLKQEKGQLKFSVVDLLEQNVSVYRYVYENIISDSQATTLQRYFMLSFIYNIRTFSGGKVGGRQRNYFF